MNDSNRIILEADAPPKNGVWVDLCDDIIVNPTEEEIDEGNHLGETIDTNDDDDVGISVRSLGSFERERALSKARELKAIMLDYGVPEVSIELEPGRPNNFGSWDALFVVADMSHHTVSRYSSRSLTPVLSLCKWGRSDLPGPLCNGYGGWDLCYRILTFGYGNHPGTGGPKTVPALTAGTFTIPRDSARRYAWGTEWEGGLNAADWDRELRNPRTGHKMTFREFMGRSNAALEEYHKIHPLAHLEHSSWTSRKIDRLGYTASKGIAEKKKYSRKDWFDMATKDELKEALSEVLADQLREGLARTPIIIDSEGKTWALQRVLRHMMIEQDRLKAQIRVLNEGIKSLQAAHPTEGES